MQSFFILYVEGRVGGAIWGVLILCVEFWDSRNFKGMQKRGL